MTKKAKNHIVAPRFTPPKFVEYSDDGLPNYVVAQRGSKHRYEPPVGFRLAIFVNGQEFKNVTEADRKNGYVRVRHTMIVDGVERHMRDTDGELMFRLYENVAVRFVLVPLPQPRNVIVSPNGLRI